MLLNVGDKDFEFSLSLRRGLYIDTPWWGLFAYLEEESTGPFYRDQLPSGTTRIWWGRLHVLYSPPREKAYFARIKGAERAAWWADLEARAAAEEATAEAAD